MMATQQKKAPSQRSSSKGGSHFGWILGGVGFLIVAIVLLCGVLIPFDVTVNGEKVATGFASTASDAIKASSAEPKPGNLLAIDGSLLEEGAGAPIVITVNGNEAGSGDGRLSPNDKIEVANGADKTEPSHIEEAVAPASANISGTGAVHLITKQAEPGVQDMLVGDVSGVSQGTVKQEPVNAEVVRQNIDTGGAPVIALTFDDGPQTTYTTQILDVLAKNGAKATFFTVGSRITGDNVGVVKRAVDEGHMVTTHSFSHAAGSGKGVNLGYMSDEEMVAEIVNGLDAVRNAAGIEPSTYIRVPGGNFGENVVANLSPYIKGDIGWNIDTQDWERPGVEAIKNQLLSVTPGDIVLMHDGGGDRSQTVEALSKALPELSYRGYKFVTVEELLQYL